MVRVRQCGHSGQRSAQATIKLRNVTIYCHHCHSLPPGPSVSTGQHTQWFLMAAKCASSVPVLHTAVWCWWWLRYLLIWVLLSNLPIRNPYNQTQIHQSEYLSMNSTFALCWKEINCRSNGLSILSIWESFTPNLWSPDGGNTIHLLRGPSFNSVGAGSWPVTRHVRASRRHERRHVTCPRHPQHHVSIRVTVRTAPPPSLMYYYRNYSCLITHYTLHITHYTLQTFLVVTLWQVTSHPPPPLDIHYPGVLGWPTLGLSE